MLSRGSKQIKLSLGITPLNHDSEDIEPELSNVECLSPEAENFISELEENPSDEAKKHRKEILREFRGYCEFGDIDADEIEEWPRLGEIADEDEAFVEAMDDYSEWGITQDTDTPMTVYALGRMYAAYLHWFEGKSDGQNHLQEKSKSVLSENPEKVQSLIAIRAIANGD